PAYARQQARFVLLLGDAGRQLELAGLLALLPPVHVQRDGAAAAARAALGAAALDGLVTQPVAHLLAVEVLVLTAVAVGATGLGRRGGGGDGRGGLGHDGHGEDGDRSVAALRLLASHGRRGEQHVARRRGRGLRLAVAVRRPGAAGARRGFGLLGG